MLAENSGRWEGATARDVVRVEAIARAVMARLLHEPTIRLRGLEDERGGAGGHGSLELIRELFGLREDASEQPGEQPGEELAEVHDLERRRSAPSRRK